MNQENLDHQVGEMRKKQEALLTSMQSASQKVIEASIEFLKGWNKKVVEEATEKNPDLILKLGSESVAKIKKELADFDNRIGALATNMLNKDEIWFHKSQIKKKADGGSKPGRAVVVERMISKSRDDVLRELMGKIAGILEKHGFIKLTHSMQWRRTSEGETRWSIVYTETPALKSALAEYREFESECRSLESNINQLLEQMKDKNAKRLWNES